MALTPLQGEKKDVSWWFAPNDVEVFACPSLIIRTLKFALSDRKMKIRIGMLLR